MTAAVDHVFVVRPRPETAEEFAGAWFASPQPWLHRAVFGTSQADVELKTSVLARIAVDAARGDGEAGAQDARRFLARGPLTMEAFDHAFEVECLGPGFDAPDLPRVPAATLGLLATATPSGPAAHALAVHADRTAAVLAALRFALPALHRHFAARLADTRCSIGSYADLVDERALESALRTSGLELGPRGSLHVAVVGVDGPVDEGHGAVLRVELRVVLRAWEQGPRKVHDTDARVALARGLTGWDVTSADVGERVPLRLP